MHLCKTHLGMLEETSKAWRCQIEATSMIYILYSTITPCLRGVLVPLPIKGAKVGSPSWIAGKITSYVAGLVGLKQVVDLRKFEAWRGWMGNLTPLKWPVHDQPLPKVSILVNTWERKGWEPPIGFMLAFPWPLTGRASGSFPTQIFPDAPAQLQDTEFQSKAGGLVTDACRHDVDLTCWSVHYLVWIG